MNTSVDISLENFEQVILQDSQEKLVMIEFWAQGYAPSDEIAPVLASVARKYPDTLIHARVDCQAQPEIVQQFGVRGLPTVILVKEGQPVDGFAGPQGEAQIIELLNKHLPKAEDGLVAQAQELISAGNYQQAYTLAKQAYDLDSSRADIKLLLADCQIELGQVNQAKAMLATIGLVDQDALYKSIQGKIELAEQAAESPEIIALQQELANDPDNLDLKVRLAVQLHQANQIEEALDLALAVLMKDLNFGDAKKLTLDMINALPDGDPLKSKYRRKVYSLLY
ncbi:MAG: tetratricopeptide repeat protein [Paraglaciecola sp.]|uniref:tetratricopeptide repeat protein n=1 Tax=Paraglaciecola sp. TaxID=1920173 RepID=UPI00273D605B|nr:tetratricopeptide repeat protein [Paraglaciecola sp.]MDP5033226.1 tetratricopeptide repeat protein [Paraglaciecola sp.]MDP5040116.1 tetratricopeptide repeat protein [Paraglaciecola sp.]MDP5130379.1 tetratricopeptide repeat protein [Paraglaciecola sp.]